MASNYKVTLVRRLLSNIVSHHEVQHHNEYPLAVESVKVHGVRKLIPNLYDKEKYVVHHEALRCYLENGMVLKKIHSGISYEERDFMKEFIDINAEARKVAKNDLKRASTNSRATASSGKPWRTEGTW